MVVLCYASRLLQKGNKLSEQHDVSALRREIYLRLAGVLGTIDELIDQPNVVLEGGYTKRADREPCECYVVDGEAAFAEMLTRVNDTVGELVRAQNEYERAGVTDPTLISDIGYALNRSQAMIAEISEARHEWDLTSMTLLAEKYEARSETERFVASRW